MTIKITLEQIIWLDYSSTPVLPQVKLGQYWSLFTVDKFITKNGLAQMKNAEKNLH